MTTNINYLNQHKPTTLAYKLGSDEGETTSEFLVGYTPHKSGTYRVEVDNYILNVGQFSTAIQVLEQAKEDDDVVIMLQTGGGSVNAGEAFIHAMRKCEAPIHIVATGGVHSMGTHILIEADSIELSHGFHALLHCGADGAYGNVNEYAAKSKFDQEFRTRQFRESYEGFLSEKEIDAMLEGKDIWLDAPGWMARAKKRSEYFQAKYEAAMKPARKSRTKTVKKAPKELALPQEK